MSANQECDPQQMLESLRALNDSRKCRLFATACCRRIWECLSDELRAAVVLAEQAAEGVIDDNSRVQASRAVNSLCIYVDGDSSAADRYTGFAAEAVLNSLFGDGDYPPIPTYATTCAIAASFAVLEVIIAKAELDGKDEAEIAELVRLERSWQCTAIQQLFSKLVS